MAMAHNQLINCSKVPLLPYQNTKRGTDPDASTKAQLHVIRTAPVRDSRHEGIAIARAVVVSLLAGTALWYLLWKLAMHVRGLR